MLQQLLRDSVGGHTIDSHCRPGRRRADAEDRLKTSPGSSDSLVQSIHALRAQGESFASIAAALNKQGCSGGYGGRWYASSVWAYLHRRAPLPR